MHHIRLLDVLDVSFAAKAWQMMELYITETRIPANLCLEIFSRTNSRWKRILDLVLNSIYSQILQTYCKYMAKYMKYMKLTKHTEILPQTSNNESSTNPLINKFTRT